jgi:hypothetical protein
MFEESGKKPEFRANHPEPAEFSFLGVIDNHLPPLAGVTL